MTDTGLFSVYWLNQVRDSYVLVVQDLVQYLLLVQSLWMVVILGFGSMRLSLASCRPRSGLLGWFW